MAVRPRNVASKKTTRTDAKSRDSRPKKDHGKRKNGARRGEPPKDPTDEKHTNPSPNITLTLEKDEEDRTTPLDGRKKTSSITVQLMQIGKQKETIQIQGWTIVLLALG